MPEKLKPACKIIVLAPVRNEDWIVERFLAVTSLFADVIIVLDQASEDTSREIYRRFPKVHLIEQQVTDYDEASRQTILIDRARQLIRDKRILIALDADEILVASALRDSEWDAIRSAEPGTVLMFEKPDALPGCETCVRLTPYWPLGYVDNGVQHEPSKVHSIRIPTPRDAPRLYLQRIKFLHYGLCRSAAQRSKMRLYSVVECASSIQPLHRRVANYGRKRRYYKESDVTKIPEEWTEIWRQLAMPEPKWSTGDRYWYDVEVLRMFAKFGAAVFRYDDIWNVDWEEKRVDATVGKKGPFPTAPIMAPSKVVGAATVVIAQAMHTWRRITSHSRGGDAAKNDCSNVAKVSE